MVGVPEAGLEPFVPRVRMTLAGADRRRPDGAPGLRGVQGPGGRRGLRPRRGARPARARVDAGRRRDADHRPADGAAASSLSREPTVSEGDRRRPRRHQARGGPPAGRRAVDSLIEPTDLLRLGCRSSTRLVLVDPAAGEELDGSGSACPRWSSSRAAGLCPRSTCRSPTSPCARCSAIGSGFRCSSTTTPRSRRWRRHTISELRMVARDLVMLTIGTGVGGGLVLGGRIYRGATGGAGELGHTLIGAQPRRVLVPRASTLSAARLAGAGRRWTRARRARGRVRSRKHPDSALARLVCRGWVGARRDAVEAAQLRMPPAAGGWSSCGRKRVGVGVANAINTFDPKRW